MPQLSEEQKQQYNEYVKQVTPTHNLWAVMGKAFLVGGIICTIGQFVGNFLKNQNVEEKAADTWTLIFLIAASMILTGLGLYAKIGKFAGAGSLVPITGFANSVVAPAVEFNAEGQVFGIGCKIFTIAGPVILFGILSSWVLGVIYWILQSVGVF